MSISGIDLSFERKKVINPIRSKTEKVIFTVDPQQTFSKIRLKILATRLLDE